jgi:hypothetical protein
MKNLNKRGGKGMLPACCLPLWGREGVTLLVAAENNRIRKKRISTEPIFLKNLPDSAGRTCGFFLLPARSLPVMIT